MTQLLMIYLSFIWFCLQVIRDRRLQDKPWMVYAFLAELLGQGLLTTSGDFWRHHRALIQPSFHLGVLERFVEVFNEEATALVARLSESDNRDIDYPEYIGEATSRATVRATMSFALEDSDVYNLQVGDESFADIC